MITSDDGTNPLGFYDGPWNRLDGVPDIAVLDTVRTQPTEVPIIPDALVYFSSGAAVVIVFLGLCIMAYMLIFTEAPSRDVDELYGLI